MRTIHKFMIENMATTRIALPPDARIVHVTMQNDLPRLWALLDTEQTPVLRTFQVFGTGAALPRAAEYRGTFIDGPFVWHLFELIDEAAEAAR